MPLFVLEVHDRPDAGALRRNTRPAHLAWLATQSARVKVGGPLLDGGGDARGSLLIVEAEGEAELRAWAADDPYVRAGLFERVEVRPWRLVVGGFAPGPEAGG